MVVWITQFDQILVASLIRISQPHDKPGSENHFGVVIAAKVLEDAASKGVSKRGGGPAKQDQNPHGRSELVQPHDLQTWRSQKRQWPTECEG